MPDQEVLPTHFFPSCLPLKGFKAYQLERGVAAAVYFARRDLYQICLVNATSKVYYPPGVETAITGNVLVFAGPHAVYSWERISPAQSGYRCLFTEDFLSRHPRLMSFLQSPLLGLGDVAVYPLNGVQNKSIATIFQQILFAQDSAYAFRHELIANCLHVLTHEALKMQPSQIGYCC